MDLLISIIVPMYNSEKYILKTVNSLINQTYRNIEIVVVDDGSTDNSKKIVLEKNKDIRLKYIYQQNSGAPTARNFGYSESSGDYVIFFDADDEMKLDAVEKMLTISNNGEKDLIVGSYNRIDGNGNSLTTDNQVKLYEMIKNETNHYEKLKLIAHLDPVPGNKMIKRNFIEKNKLQYSQLKIGQDLNFYLKIIACIPEVSISSVNVFSYRIHESGISRTYTRSILDIIRSFKKIANNNYDFFVSNPEILETLKFNHFSYHLYKIPFFSDKQERKTVYSKFKAAFKELNLDLIDTRFINVNRIKVGGAIKFGQIFTSDSFSKVFTRLNNQAVK